jgi:hypothetical protein
MKGVTMAILIGSLALAVLPAAAQKAELSGGYQLMHFDGGTNFNGWNAALTGNFAPFLGETGDFSGIYIRGPSSTPTALGRRYTRAARM